VNKRVDDYKTKNNELREQLQELKQAKRTAKLTSPEK
jgi:uncharacterized protein YeeX (DUF496 family)